MCINVYTRMERRTTSSSPSPDEGSLGRSTLTTVSCALSREHFFTELHLLIVIVALLLCNHYDVGRR